MRGPRGDPSKIFDTKGQPRSTHRASKRILTAFLVIPEKVDNRLVDPRYNRNDFHSVSSDEYSFDYSSLL